MIRCQSNPSNTVYFHLFLSLLKACCSFLFLLNFIKLNFNSLYTATVTITTVGTVAGTYQYKEMYWTNQYQVLYSNATSDYTVNVVKWFVPYSTILGIVDLNVEYKMILHTVDSLILYQNKLSEIVIQFFKKYIQISFNIKLIEN